MKKQRRQTGRAKKIGAHWKASIGLLRSREKEEREVKGKKRRATEEGYGECCNCGAQGHPARECPFPGKLHGGVDAAGKGTAAALKGKGKNNGK